MDNLTHSLIGAAVGKTIEKKAGKSPPPAQARAAFWACVIGNNLPDLDFVVHFFPRTDRLDYLVHHRGYTHTILFALPLAYLGAWIAAKVCRQKKPTWTLFAVTYLSCLLHIAADFMNNYGVHPFTPFSSRWIYGDAVFIVEPLLWLGLIPYLFREAETKLARGFLAALAAGMLFLLWTNGLSSMPTALFATAWGALHAGVAWILGRAGPRARRPAAVRTAALVALGLVPAIFFTRAAIVKAALRAEFAREFPAEAVTDVDLMSAPANPFCAKLWVASRTADAYRFRSFRHDPLGWCPDIETKAQTARVSPFTVSASFAPSFRPEALSELPKAAYARYASQSCEFRYLMAFVRFPFIRETLTENVYAGDLRYDREEGLGFSEIVMRKTDRCAHGEPPWRSPFEP